MNPIRTALEQRGATLGTWYGTRCTIAAEAFGAVGFDWVIVDLQHGSVGWDMVLPLLQTLQLGGTKSLIRVTSHDPAEIGRALDIGAIGVVVPLVSTAEQARLVAEAMQYPPAGTRSYGQLRKTLGADTLNNDPFCVVMIETLEGMGNLDAIAATPGVDCILLGAVDLAVSMGLPAEQIYTISPPPPPILQAVEALVAACARHGKVAGNAAMNAAATGAMLAQGVRFIPVFAALGFMLAAARQELAACRGAVAQHLPQG